VGPVRRPLLGLAVLSGCLVATLQPGSTASSSVPTTTAVHRQTAVSGATMTSIRYEVTGGAITTVTPRLRGIDLLTKTVQAAFGAGAAVPCTAGVLTVLDVLTGLGEATYTCTGLLEDADRPRRLQITVS
jgi:hypothetical protein